MIYQDLQFKKPSGRPFFYTNFVSTVDGKVFVKKDGYWPIGSQIDLDVFTLLRAHADTIIDGKNTALVFGKRTIKRIHDQNFIELRNNLGKERKLEYIVLTNSPNEELKKKLQNPFNYAPTFFTKENIIELITVLKEKQHEYVFIDGGPTVLRSFLATNLLDEIFLTISPKIFGGRDETLTLVEGPLFFPEEIKHLTLISSQTIEDEVFLRYKVLH